MAVGTQSRHFSEEKFRVVYLFVRYLCHTQQTSIFHAKVHLHRKMILRRFSSSYKHTNTHIHTMFMFSNQNVYFRHPLEIHAICAIQIHKIHSYTAHLQFYPRKIVFI